MISGHDTESAVFKTEEYFNALTDGHFPPRWAKRLDYGLGQPTFTFTYSLPFGLTSAAMLTGMDALWAFKLVMAATFPAAAFFTYLWLKNRFGFWPGLAGGIVYALAPYHFANVYVRGAIGESVASALLPLSFYLLDRAAVKTDGKRMALAAIGIAAVILSHQFYGLVFSVIWAAYAVINRMPRAIIPTIIWGYVISAFYIIPAVAYKNLTYLDKMENFFLEKQDFVSLSKLIYSPWGFAAVAETHKDPMSVQIGFTAIAVLIGAGIAAAKFKKNRKLILFFLVLSLGAIFMMLPISLPVWKIVTPLRALQFPWRLLFIVNLGAGFATGYLLSQTKRQAGIAVLVIALVLISSRGFWQVGRYYPKTDLPDTNKTIGYPGTLTMLLEETPKWHVIMQESNPYTFFNVQSGLAGVKNLVWKTNYHKFEVKVEETAVINDKTHYWPGWKVFVDGKETKLIDPYDELSQGTLAFEVGPGVHTVESKLTEPIVNKIGDAISLIGLASGLVLIFKKQNEKMA
jgi:hypothetical protein